MSERRLEEIDFRPRLPIVRLVLTSIVFGVMGFVFASEKRFEFTFRGRPTAGDLFETAGIAVLLLFGYGFITSFLLLPFRLKFSDAGIRRFTLSPPWFIPWRAVRAAQMGSYKGYLALELSVSRFRWICIPLIEYRRGALLLEEIRKRLPVQVHVSEKHLSQLKE